MILWSGDDDTWNPNSAFQSDERDRTPHQSHSQLGRVKLLQLARTPPVSARRQSAVTHLLRSAGYGENGER